MPSSLNSILSNFFVLGIGSIGGLGLWSTSLDFVVKSPGICPLAFFREKKVSGINLFVMSISLSLGELSRYAGSPTFTDLLL